MYAVFDFGRYHIQYVEHQCEFTAGHHRLVSCLTYSARLALTRRSNSLLGLSTTHVGRRGVRHSITYV